MKRSTHHETPNTPFFPFAMSNINIMKKINALMSQMTLVVQDKLKVLKKDPAFLSFVQRLLTKRNNDDSGARKVAGQRRRVKSQVYTQERLKDIILDALQQFVLSVAQEVRSENRFLFTFDELFFIDRYHVLSPLLFDLQEHLQSTYDKLQEGRTTKDSKALESALNKEAEAMEARAKKVKEAAENLRLKQEAAAAEAASKSAKPSWHFESQEFEAPLLLAAPMLQRRSSARLQLSAPSPAAVLQRTGSEISDESQQSVGSRRKAASIDSSQVKRRKRLVIVEESTQELDEADESSEEDSDAEESQESLTKLMRKSKVASQGSQDLD